MTGQPGEGMNPDAVYADLRRRGEVTLPWWEAPTLVPALRRRAAKDGLRIVQSRGHGHRHLTRDQARRRPTYVALTVDGTTLVAPDAGSLDTRR
jgi:hypothetical protein